MMVHPQVGPGADTTMTPFGIFPPQLQPYAQPFANDISGNQQDAFSSFLMNQPQQQQQQQLQQLAPQSTNKGPQWAVDDGVSDMQPQLFGSDPNFGALVDAGLGNQIAGQTQMYWNNIVDGE
jgi:hypothetical protein